MQMRRWALPFLGTLALALSTGAAMRAYAQTGVTVKLVSLTPPQPIASGAAVNLTVSVKGKNISKVFGFFRGQTPTQLSPGGTQGSYNGSFSAPVNTSKPEVKVPLYVKVTRTSGGPVTVQVALVRIKKGTPPGPNDPPPPPF